VKLNRIIEQSKRVKLNGTRELQTLPENAHRTAPRQ
jgi:hypothetical protein